MHTHAFDTHNLGSSSSVLLLVFFFITLLLVSWIMHTNNKVLAQNEIAMPVEMDTYASYHDAHPFTSAEQLIRLKEV